MITHRTSKQAWRATQTDTTDTPVTPAAPATPAVSKTYMAPGLMELRLVLHVGNAWIPVVFKGGRRGGYGDYQALFSTDDPTLQFVIERSPEYLSRRIVLCKGK